MKIVVVPIALLVFLSAGCDNRSYYGGPEKVLISEKYRDSDTWEVVCKGYPLENSDGLPRVESAKMAARLNAYLFAREIFDNSVIPDKDGRVEKYVIFDDFVVLYYVIEKKGLSKRMIKK